MNRMLATAVEIEGPAGPNEEGARRVTGETGLAGTSSAARRKTGGRVWSA